MAINKKIELENGVITTYHRIVSVNQIINVGTILEVASYTDEKKREEEKEAIKNSEPMNVFINTEYIDTEYSDKMNIEEAYKFLKTVDKYKKASDC